MAERGMEMGCGGKKKKKSGGDQDAFLVAIGENRRKVGFRMVQKWGD